MIFFLGIRQASIGARANPRPVLLRDDFFLLFK
jgi:hypothetical protein